MVSETASQYDSQWAATTSVEANLLHAGNVASLCTLAKPNRFCVPLSFLNSSDDYEGQGRDGAFWSDRHREST
jgi:hypothetical protein